MSITSTLIKISFKLGDAKRDKNLQIPQSIVRLDDVFYYKDKRESGLLDIYLPKRRKTPLPIIISIHGGGWVYGSKEAYQHYCMHLAQYGFAVINFNYRLAPKHKFPAALEDVNSVFQWVKETGHLFDFDLENIFIVGDSAGAQIASQYAAIITNEAYAKLFQLDTPAISIRAMGLTSGIFDPVARVKYQGRYGVNRLIKAIMEDYLGKDILHYEKEMDFLSNINKDFPPVFIANSVNDIVAGKCPAFVRQIKDAGVPYIYKKYGQEDKTLGHVFHLNIKRQRAREFNKEQIEFFQQHIIKNFIVIDSEGMR